MKLQRFIVILICLLTGCKEDSDNSNPVQTTPAILVFSATQGFRHASIADGKTAILQMGQQFNWRVDTTENPSDFNVDNLKRYQAVIFLNTTGDVLDSSQQSAFESYIQSGGSFVGIHSATDTEYNWPWYNQLVGAYFQNHPAPQTAMFHVHDSMHPSVSFMPDSLQRFEEIYNFTSMDTSALTVLMTVDENSYSGGTMNGFHPIAWCHHFDGGKSFYTAWGHFPDAYTEEVFLKHLEGGIRWAIQ